ncbi:flagellar export protein FliJ [Gracilibacillus sp. YIM 98692]|uniref:flagellar export protein FliJ n=1 Tax=Gracilibacillus sp. YIM 98692 TaxID=2663532 RepID=UPI0013D306D0|nr:flagellar export protein FliJ [Gracilibacillus sp. YIM 98692]
MNPSMKLDRIKLVKDNEAEKIRGAYQDSEQQFEQEATHLYKLLKKKEEVESLYTESLYQKTQVQQLQAYQQYLNYLTPTIMERQKKVNQARQNMYELQDQLTDQYIEVKKIEKIIEKRKQKQSELEKVQEQMRMDDISVRRYTNQRGRQ